MYTKKAAEYGYTKSDFLVDGLVLTVAANQQACLETLNVIRWSTNEFGANTVIGLSNVSFGLPERKWINAALSFYGNVQGLTAVIMNVQSEETMHIKRATDALRARIITAYTTSKPMESKMKQTGTERRQDIQLHPGRPEV